VGAWEGGGEGVGGGWGAGADLPPARELDGGPILDARRDPDLDGAPGAHPAVRVAFGARPPDDGAVAAAGGTRPGGHDLAEEGPGDLAHLAAPRAHVAGLRMGAGRGALARAGGADHRRVHHQFPGRPERAFGEIEVHPDGGVAAPAGAAARPSRPRASAEERVHDVAEREPGPEPPRPAGPGGSGPGERVRPEVVHLPLLGVGEHLVGLCDLLEPLLRLRVRVDVRVQLPGEPPVGLLDLVGTRVAADSEDSVVVVHARSPPGSGLRTLPPRAPLPSPLGSPSALARARQAGPPPDRRSRSRPSPGTCCAARPPGPPPRSARSPTTGPATHPAAA